MSSNLTAIIEITSDDGQTIPTCLSNDIVFASQSNTQSFRFGNLNSNEYIVINSNVGIGISNPTKKLHVIGDGQFTSDLTIGGNLILSGASTFSSNLNITGFTSLSNTLNVIGATSLSNTLNVLGTTKLSSNLNVTGPTSLGNTVNITGAVALSNNFRVSGVSILSGNVGIGTLTPASALHVYGNLSVNPLIPGIHIGFEGGSIQRPGIEFSGSTDTIIDMSKGDGTDYKGRIYYNHPASNMQFFTNGNSTSALTLNDINALINGSLNVVGSTTLSNTLNVNGSALFSNTINVNGSTVLSSNLNVSGSTVLSSNLNVSGPTILSSNLNVSGSTVLFSNLNVSGSSALSNTLNVIGSTSLSNTLTVSGSTILSSNLNVLGSVSLSNILNVIGSTSLSNTLNVIGSTSLSNTLNVAGITSLSNNLNVAGITSLSNILNVTGATSLSNNLNVNGSVILLSNLNVSGSSTLSNTLNVIGSTSLSNTLNIIGSTSLSNTLNVIGSTSLSNTLNVIGSTSLSNNLIVVGITSLSNNLNVSGSVMLSNILNVAGATSLSNNLSITGNIGIGTFIANEKLHIYSSNARIRLQDTISSNNFTTLDFYNSSNLNGYVGYFGTSNLRLFNTMGTGSVKLYTSNVERLMVDPVGNVGINTNNPLNKLHVVGDALFTSNVTVGGVLNISGAISLTGSSIFNSNVLLTSGNIGIGTTNPQDRIHIYGSNSMLRLQDITSNNIATAVEFYNLSNLSGFLGYSNSQDLLLNNSASNGSLRIYTSNIERLTINSNGNIGVSNINPEYTFDINGNLKSKQIISNNITGSNLSNSNEIPLTSIIQSTGYISSASSTLSTYPTTAAFNKTIGTIFDTWLCLNGRYTSGTGLPTASAVSTVIQNVGTITGEWLQLELPSAKYISSYKYAPQSSLQVRAAVNHILAGSSNNSTWLSVNSESNISWPDSSSKTFTCKNPNSYKYYRLIAQTINTGDYFSVAELAFFGRDINTSGSLTITNGDLIVNGTIKCDNFHVNTLTNPNIPYGVTNSYIPFGGIIMWNGNTNSVPMGWLLCNGQEVPYSNPSIFTPNLQDRFIIGAGSTYTTGSSAGSTTITVANLPAHSHTGTVNSSGSHAHTMTTGTASANHRHNTFADASSSDTTVRNFATRVGNAGADSKYAITYTDGVDANTALTSDGGANHTHSGTTDGVDNTNPTTAAATGGNHTHTFTTNNTGSGSAYLQPYYALAYIMKI